MEDTMAEATTEKKPLGTKWLAEHVNEECGTSYTAYQLRILLRKLVKDEVIERTEGNYAFKGERDPQVRAIVKAVKAGALEAEKKAKLADAKASKAKKAQDDDEDEAPKPRRSRSRKAAAEEVEEEAPKPRRSRAKKAAPVEEDDDIDLDEI